jgi:hypothetical protein
VGRIDRLFARGTRQFDQWMTTDAPASLDAAIETLSTLDALLPAGDPRQTLVDVQLSVALIGRHKLAESPADLNAAVPRLERLVTADDLPAEFNVNTARLFLGEALTERMEWYGRPDYPFPLPGNDEFCAELRTAVSLFATAADAAPLPEERAEAARLREYLLPKLTVADAVAARTAGRSPPIDDLERTLHDLPGDHPVRGRLILELGYAHLTQLNQDVEKSAAPGSSAHREPAARYLNQGLALLAADDPERADVAALLVYLGHLTATLGLGRLPAASPGPLPPERLAELAASYAADPAADPRLRPFLQALGVLSQPGGLASSGRDAAFAQLTEALQAAEGDETLTAVVQSALSSLLSHPAGPTRSLDDLATQDAVNKRLFDLAGKDALAAAEADPVSAGLLAQAGHPSVRHALAGSDAIRAALLAGDKDGIDAAIGELQRDLGAMPPGHALGWIVAGLLGGAWRARGLLSGNRGDSVRGLETQLDAYRQGLDSPFLAGADAAGLLRQRVAYDQAQLATLTGSARALSAAIRDIADLDAAAMSPGQRVSWGHQYGMALIQRYGLDRDPADLDRGIARLEQAVRESGQLDAGAVDYAPAQNLSTAYWTRSRRSRRDQARAIEAGLLALRQRAAGVLLQSGAADGLLLARWHGGTQVLQLVGWCLAEGRADQAVEALELGRALVLHAATVGTDIPALLRAAGQDTLATEWEAEAADGASAPGAAFAQLLAGPADALPLRIPSALRRQVLDALRGTPAGEPLLAAPSLAELAAGLRRGGADWFVYLVPPFAGQDGRALLLDARGDTGQLALPGLSDGGPLTAYETASREAADSDWVDLGRWNQALEDLCDWAWAAAVGPLLGHLASQPRSTPPRLVVIPVGPLSLVPWHAARTKGPDGRPRHALQDAVFSYAAAAGQFARASNRASRPASAAPVLVANPTGDLPLAELEVKELRRRYYPDADYLGRPAARAAGSATAAELLSRLPGGSRPLASLLHCGCHASVAASLAHSYLLLGDGQLRIADILGQAQRHPAASPGFLAVLSACMTDLAATDHDEALTLASALLAAGASSVVGARWPVPDKATAPLMVMFHHFLASGCPHPPDALRAAQLWMLDPERPVLDGLPEELSAAAASWSLRRPYAWAAFTCQGGA